jgi:hypothetical protein
MDRQRIALEIIVGCFLFTVNQYRFNISKNADQTAPDGRGDKACPTPYQPC